MSHGTFRAAPLSQGQLDLPSSRAFVEFREWLRGMGLTDAGVRFQHGGLTEGSEQEMPHGFPRVDTAGGLPEGWQWMAPLGADTQVARARREWVLLQETVPDHPYRTVPHPAGRIVDLRLVAVYESLGDLCADVFGREQDTASDWTGLAGLLDRCPPDPSTDPDDASDARDGERLLRALGAPPAIPHSAYSPDLDLRPVC